MPQTGTEAALNYIRKRREEGISDQQIAYELRQSGWDKETVQNLLDRADPREVQQDPARGSSSDQTRSSANVSWLLIAVLVIVLALPVLWIMGEAITGDAGREATESWAEYEAAEERAVETPRGSLKAPQNTQTTKRWVKVKEWRGKGMKTTESFTVGDEWAVEWNTQPGQFEGNFIVQANHPGQQIGKSVANVIGRSHDTSYIYEAGTFYLDINSTQPWHVIIWDKQ